MEKCSSISAHFEDVGFAIVGLWLVKGMEAKARTKMYILV
jgi:hypothetical protein